MRLDLLVLSRLRNLLTVDQSVKSVVCQIQELLLL